jgi:hypothetical protein
MSCPTCPFFEARGHQAWCKEIGILPQVYLSKPDSAQAKRRPNSCPYRHGQLPTQHTPPPLTHKDEIEGVSIIECKTCRHLDHARGGHYHHCDHPEVDGRSRDMREKINSGVQAYLDERSAPNWCPYLRPKPKPFVFPPKEQPKILKGRKDAPWGGAPEKKPEPKYFNWPKGFDEWVPPPLDIEFETTGEFKPATPHEQAEQLKRLVDTGLMTPEEARELLYGKGGNK